MSPERRDYGVYSVCDTPRCPNKGRVANHPRSEDPKHCGICGRPVRMIRAKSIRMKDEPYETEMSL